MPAAPEGGHGGPVCVCAGRFAAPCGLCGGPPHKAEDHHDPYDPGSTVPEHLRSGLKEIYDAIRQTRDPYGGRALCRHVLGQLLDDCDKRWPETAGDRAAHAAKPDSYLTTALVVACAVAAGLADKLSGVVLLSAIVKPLSTAEAHGLDIAMAAALGGAGGFLAAQAIIAAAGGHKEKKNEESPVHVVAEGLRGVMAPSTSSTQPKPKRRLERIRRLQTEGVVTKALLAWAGTVELEAPEPPKPPARPPPALAPTDADVRRLGAFILILADQVYEAPHKLAAARDGAWPSTAADA